MTDLLIPNPLSAASLCSEKVSSLAREAEEWSPQEVLRFALDRFHPSIAFASSFGVEDAAVVDMLAKIREDARIFTLDTGRLPQETYEVMEQLREKYGIGIEVHFPDREAVEGLEREKGFYSFRTSLEERKRCCGIRKVVPLGRALDGLEAWITGLRREQAPTRAGVPVFETDHTHGRILKVNPLARWSEGQVWEYVRANRVPYNRLHDQGYPSIGCAPCTRAVQPGEDVRAGRWWWESPELKECGLHRSEEANHGRD
jgi:phosphoadenosine phosphosulfate reductase